MSVGQAFLLLSAMMTRFSVLGYEQRCHENPRKGLHFNDEGGPATLAIGCVKGYIEMECCASGIIHVTWYQSTDGGRTWKDFLSVKSGSSTRELSEKGQLAKIRNIDPVTDGGFYKCIAHGRREGESIENTRELEIRDCSSWSEPPRSLYPLSQETDVFVTAANNISLVCSTFSGTNCTSSDISCTWFWRKKSPFPDQISENSSARVRQKISYRSEFLSMFNIMHIMNVNDDDFGTYVCYAGNQFGFAKDRIVHIRRQYPEVLIPITAGPVAGILLFISLAGLLVIQRTRLDINLKAWLIDRRLKAADVERTVMLLHSRNVSFASYIKRSLEVKYNFTVFSSDELNAGEVEISRLPELARERGSVLVILTRDVARDEQMRAIIGDIISDDPDPVFVLYGISSTDVGDHGDVQLGRNFTGAMTINKPISWPGMAENTLGVEEEQLGDITHWEGGRTREIDIFFKTLRLSLLKAMENKNRAKFNERSPLLAPARS